MSPGFWHPKTFAVGVSVVGVALLVAGVLLPKLFIGSGVRLYKDEERNFAEYAMSWESVVRDDPLPFVVARRLTEVERLPRKGYACDPNAEVSRS